MIRYLNSFFITLSLYLITGFTLFSMFADEKITVKESEPLKKISLNHIELKKEIVEVAKPKKIEKKKVEKKIEPKKVEKKKKIIKKKIVKNKVKEIKKPKKLKEVKLDKPKTKKIIKKETVKHTVTKASKKVVKTPKKVDIREDYLKQHLALIRKYIMQNVKYPKRAKRMHIQDVIRVKFTLLQNGKITNIKILSGNKHLQKSTIKALEKASSSFPKVSRDIDIVVPIEYKLI